MQVRGIVKEQRMMSETARLRMKMFLVLAGTLLMIDEMMMKLFPRKPITAKEAYKMRNEKYQQFVNLQVSRQQTRFLLWSLTFQSQKWLYNANVCLSVSKKSKPPSLSESCFYNCPPRISALFANFKPFGLFTVLKVYWLGTRPIFSSIWPWPWFRLLSYIELYINIYHQSTFSSIDFLINQLSHQ